MKAVVLAAGRGSRLGPTDLPKPLWSIADGVTIVGRQIELLCELGVEVGVVVGWRADLVRERLADLDVRFVANTHPDISASGTAHSLQFAACSDFDPLGGDEPCLLLDADLVYERAVLRSIVESSGTALLVSPATLSDDEEVRVYADDGRPRLIGKGLRPPLTDGLHLLGEATGIVRYDPVDHAFVRAALDWHVGRGADATRPFGPVGIGTEHEVLSQFLMQRDRIEARVLADGMLFMEADFPEDFERARADVYPEILRRDAT